MADVTIMGNTVPSSPVGEEIFGKYFGSASLQDDEHMGGCVGKYRITVFVLVTGASGRDCGPLAKDDQKVVRHVLCH